MTLSAIEILRKGYFPAELPPPFNTQTFADAMLANGSNLPVKYHIKAKPAQTSHCATHNLLRVGALRRELSLPNPVNYFQLAAQLAADWPAVNAFLAKGKISLSRPKLRDHSERAISRGFELSVSPTARANVRAVSRFILKADITAFYPSVYTHSIPWALSTKAVAKAAKTSTAVLGNELDRLSRNLRDGQTVGVPIGPDTSLVLAESVLTAVEIEIGTLGIRGFRYIDDFEFGFRSYADAENGLARLQEGLAEFELELNSHKTAIIELPEPLEEPWISELRVLNIRNGRRDQRYDLIRFFGLAFELAKSNPRSMVLKYAVARMRGEAVARTNWALYQNMLLQCASSEPGSLRSVLDELKHYSNEGFPLDTAAYSQCLSAIIARHSPLGHGSEVAWSVWCAIVLNIHLEPDSVEKLIRMPDSVVALLGLDANARGLLGAGVSLPVWQAMMTDQELHDEHWLLAYEANVKGWLTGVGGSDNVARQPDFQFLKANGVSFYDANAAGRFVPRRASKKVEIVATDMSS